MTTEKHFAPGPRDLFQIALALILSIAGIAVLLKISTFRNYYFTSDTLYMFDYFRSLKAGTLSSFQYSHLPNLFPEGSIMLPLLAAQLPWQSVYAVYSVSMFLVLMLSVRRIYQTVSPETGDAAFYLFILSTLPMFLLHPGRLLHVLLAGIHGGSFAVSVLAAVLSWRFLCGTSRRSSVLLMGLALIAGATTFSDVLFVFEFVIPLTAATSALAFFRRLALPKILVLNLAVAAPSAAGAVVLQLLPISPFPSSSLQDLFSNTLRFASLLQASIVVGSVLPFLAVLLGFGACLYSGSGQANAGIVSSIIRFCGSPLTEKSTADAWLFYWVFGLAASLAGWGMTIVAFEGFSAYRYAIGFFWWPLILGCTLLARPALRFRSILPRAATLGVTGLLFGAVLWPAQSFWATDLARCLEEKSRVFSMRAGLADYWTARPVTEFLQRKLIVSPVLENGDPYLWINNRLDYFTGKDESNLRDYDFIILEKLDGAQIVSRFGRPSNSFQCGTYDVAQYDDPSVIRASLARWFAEHK
jgi:hypothetical protein